MLVSLIVLAGGCGGDQPSAAHGDSKSSVVRTSLDALPRGEEQLANLCARPGKDDVRDLFCDSVPDIRSLFDLQLALELDSDRITKLKEIKTGGVTTIAHAGHSTSLSKHKVSAINPRLFQAHVLFPSFRMVMLAFNRGEQEVELISRDRVTGELNFYLVSFRQACNDAKRGCSHADMFTDAIEKDWTEMSLYDEVDLSNTILDCATCHQPDGPGSRKRIIMQEFNAPFTHWFWHETDGGDALLSDFMAAHGDETYGNMKSEQIADTDPTLLPALILVRDGMYKGSFDSIVIEDEVKRSSAAEGGAQPRDNRVPGDSMTWRAAYEASMRGSSLSLPYHDVKVTDTDKLSRATDALQAVARGDMDAAELPELSDIFPDDPKLLAEIGLTTEPGSTGEQVLLQACAQCHRAELDPTISRARFRADLQGMSRAEKDLAIERLRLPASDPLSMPPARARVLTDDARERAIKALMR
jgi:mono/diheme cytochrome c family protein